MNGASDGAPLYGHVALIGIGLINSSLARAIRAHGLARRVTAVARRQQTLDAVMRLGIADAATSDAAAAVRDADLVVIGTPVGAMEGVAQIIGPHIPAGCTLTDVGSVKQAVIRDIGPHIPAGVHFIPGHPIAGTENSGPESGFESLFRDRWWLLTPVPGTDAAALARLTTLLTAIGARVESMEAGHHDRVLAITSHLPHLIAYTIVGTATDLEGDTQAEVVKFSASGFRDFTRIAASDPVMWRDVFLNNRDAVLEILQRFSEDLTALQRAIRWGEGDVLERHFEATRAIRRGVIEAGQAGQFDPREPDQG